MPWAILLAVVFASVVLYFAAMLEVIGQISGEEDDLELLSRRWLGIELVMAGAPSSASWSDVLADLGGFQVRLAATIDLPWFLMVNKAYPELRGRTAALRRDVADISAWSATATPDRARIAARSKHVEGDLDGILSWVRGYSREQLRAFRFLLVLLAAAMVLGAVLVLGAGNLMRVQEARFLAVVDSMSDGMVLTDAADKVIHVNPAACTLLNEDAERLVGRPPPGSLAPAASAGPPRGPAVPAPANDTAAGREVLLTDSAGRRRAVSLKVESVREPSGKVRGSVYLLRDLTEWRKLVASIASTFASLQAEDASTAVQRAIDEVASLCRAEMRGFLLFGAAEETRTLGPIEGSGSFANGMTPAITEWVTRAASTGEPVFTTQESAAGDDALFLSKESLAWISAVPLWFAGTVTGAIALGSHSAGPAWGEREMAMPRILGSLVIELLAKKWAMREMNRLGFEYRELIDNANVPICGVDRDGRVNEWNRAVAILTGRERSHALAVPVVSLIDTPNGDDRYEQLLRKVLSGERFAHEELRIRQDAGGFSTLLVSGSPRLDWDGNVAGAIFIGQDISARVEGERRIKEQARALVEVQDIERLRISRELHDDVAQDLSAARIACETLFDGVEGGDSRLRERAARLSGTIASSLKAIREIAYDMRPLDAAGSGLTQSLSRLCQSFAASHALDVSFQSAGADGVVLSSEQAVNIYRIVQEGLANAWRHAKARAVSVTLVHSHPELIMRVTDDGVGFNVEQKCSEAADRRCMGLVGMRERAAILGAALQITSRTGKGTQIKVTMPLAIKERSDGPAENNPPR